MSQGEMGGAGAFQPTDGHGERHSVWWRFNRMLILSAFFTCTVARMKRDQYRGVEVFRLGERMGRVRIGVRYVLKEWSCAVVAVGSPRYGCVVASGGWRGGEGWCKRGKDDDG